MLPNVVRFWNAYLRVDKWASLILLEKPILAEVPVAQIEPDPDQPRKDVGDIEDLKASIKEHGIIQPCIVSIVSDDKYRLIAGERRFTAALAVGLETVPCIIRSIEEHRRLEVQLIENIHRKELNPIEEATTYKRLMDEFQLSQRKLAERLGKSPAGINQTLRILSLPSIILDSVQTSEHLTRSVLLEIAKLETEEEQITYFNRAKAGMLTVQLARKEKKSGDEVVKPSKVKFPIQTKRAVVTVTFEQDSATQEEISEALAEALRKSKKN